MDSPGEALMVQTTVQGRGKTPGLSRVDEGLFEAGHPADEAHPKPKPVPNWSFSETAVGDVGGSTYGYIWIHMVYHMVSSENCQNLLFLLGGWTTLIHAQPSRFKGAPRQGPIERLGVSGGSAAFFKLHLKPGSGRARDYFIGKDGDGPGHFLKVLRFQKLGRSVWSLGAVCETQGINYSQSYIVLPWVVGKKLSPNGRVIVAFSRCQDLSHAEDEVTFYEEALALKRQAGVAGRAGSGHDSEMMRESWYGGCLWFGVYPPFHLFK